VQSRPSLCAAAALSDQAHVVLVRNRNLAERTRVTAALDRLGLAHTDSRANFVPFRTAAATRLRTAAAAAGVEVAGPFPPLGDRVRVTISLPAENDRFLRVLASRAVRTQEALSALSKPIARAAPPPSRSSPLQRTRRVPARAGRRGGEGHTGGPDAFGPVLSGRPSDSRVRHAIERNLPCHEEMLF